MASSEAALVLATHPIPESLRDAWKKVEAKGHTQAVEYGLRLIASGYSIHAASAESGAERMHLSRLAAKYQLYESKLLIGGQRRVAMLALDRIEQDYIDGEVSHAQAAVDAGIAMDKIAKYEGWGKPAPPPASDYLSAIAHLTSALNTGESLTITVTKSSSDPVADAIDVTHDLADTTSS